MAHKYYDAQEYYDQLTLDAKQQAQKEEEQDDSQKAVAEALLVDLFPDCDAPAVLRSIERKMETFKAIGSQYKTDIEKGGSRYKDVLLIAMAEIVLELKEYQIIIQYLYPHLSPFMSSLLIWYRDYCGFNHAFPLRPSVSVARARSTGADCSGYGTTYVRA